MAVVGLLEIWRLKLISTQVVVHIEVGVELVNFINFGSEELCMKMHNELNDV